MGNFDAPLEQLQLTLSTLLKQAPQAIPFGIRVLLFKNLIAKEK